MKGNSVDKSHEISNNYFPALEASRALQIGNPDEITSAFFEEIKPIETNEINEEGETLNMVAPVIAAAVVQNAPQLLQSLQQLGLGGIGNTDNSSQTKAIMFYKYFPGGTRYKQAVIGEDMSVGYYKGDWRKMTDSDYSGLTLEEKNQIFPIALSMDSTLVDRYNNNWPAFWQAAQKLVIPSASNQQNNSFLSNQNGNNNLLFVGAAIAFIILLIVIVLIIKR